MLVCFVTNFKAIEAGIILFIDQVAAVVFACPQSISYTCLYSLDKCISV